MVFGNGNTDIFASIYVVWGISEAIFSFPLPVVINPIIIMRAVMIIT